MNTLMILYHSITLCKVINYLSAVQFQTSVELSVSLVSLCCIMLAVSNRDDRVCACICCLCRAIFPYSLKSLLFYVMNTLYTLNYNRPIIWEAENCWHEQFSILYYGLFFVSWNRQFFNIEDAVRNWTFHRSYDFHNGRGWL